VRLTLLAWRVEPAALMGSVELVEVMVRVPPDWPMPRLICAPMPILPELVMVRLLLLGSAAASELRKTEPPLSVMGVELVVGKLIAPVELSPEPAWIMSCPLLLRLVAISTLPVAMMVMLWLAAGIGGIAAVSEIFAASSRIALSVARLIRPALFRIKSFVPALILALRVISPPFIVVRVRLPPMPVMLVALSVMLLAMIWRKEVGKMILPELVSVKLRLKPVILRMPFAGVKMSAIAIARLILFPSLGVLISIFIPSRALPSVAHPKLRLGLGVSLLPIKTVGMIVPKLAGLVLVHALLWRS